MTSDKTEDLNNTDIEAPGGSQATHSAADSTDGMSTKSRGPRGKIADRVDRLGETLERHAMEMELGGGPKAKAAPAIRRVGRAADLSAAYVRENGAADVKRDLEGEIREHPLRSIAIALGCGYILAKILD